MAGFGYDNPTLPKITKPTPTGSITPVISNTVSIVNRTAINNATIFADETRETILFTAPQAGEYRVSGYILTTAIGDGDDGTYQIDLKWEDETKIQYTLSPLTSPINLMTLGDKQYGSVYLHLASGKQLNLTQTSSSIFSGTSKYSAFVTVERLS